MVFVAIGIISYDVFFVHRVCGCRSIMGHEATAKYDESLPAISGGGWILNAFDSAKINEPP